MHAGVEADGRPGSCIRSQQITSRERPRDSLSSTDDAIDTEDGQDHDIDWDNREHDGSADAVGVSRGYRRLMYESEMIQRIAALEQQVRRLSLAAGISCPAFPSDTMSSSGGLPVEVVELARRGKKIDAIKFLRDLTGMGLKEAKGIVDSL